MEICRKLNCVFGKECLTRIHGVYELTTCFKNGLESLGDEAKNFAYVTSDIHYADFKRSHNVIYKLGYDQSNFAHS